MAICLRRNFISCSSLAFFGRRPSRCINKKPPKFDPPIFKEMTLGEFSSLNASLNNGNSRLMTKFQASPENVYCAQECKAYKELKVNNSLEQGQGKPDKDQLDNLSNILATDLPRIFAKPMNYTIYDTNIIFENNIKGTKTKGFFAYYNYIALLKMVGHIKYAQIQFKILKITTHPEDGTIRVRWRILGISNYKALFSFIKLLTQGKTAQLEGWYDGFSIYFVGSHGKIIKHTVDKMIPDSEEKVSNIRNNLAAKMAFTVGMSIKSFSFDSLSCENALENSVHVCQVPYPLNVNWKNSHGPHL